MDPKKRALWVVILLGAGVLAPMAFCASGNLPVREYLDETSAATITVTREPFVFARERADLAVNARDYLSLVAIQINRAGDKRLYWFGYLWSTIDRQGGAQVKEEKDWVRDWVLVADGRPIVLQAVDRPLRELGIVKPPLRKPVRNARTVLYLADRDVLEYAGAAGDLSARLLRKDFNESFVLWQDARRELLDFLQYLSFQ